MTPFILVLSCHPPARADSDQPLLIQMYMSTTPKPCSFCERFLQELAELRESTNLRLEYNQVHYKRCFDKSVRVIPTFLLGQYAHVDRPPEQQTAAPRLAHEPLLKLLWKTLGRFRIILTTRDTITIEKDGIYSTVSIYRFTRPPDKTDAKAETGETYVLKKGAGTFPTTPSCKDGTN